MAVRSFRRPFGTLLQDSRSRQQEETESDLRALQVSSGNDLLKETQNSLNDFVVAGDSSLVPAFEKNHNKVLGINYRLSCTRQVVIKTSAAFSNVTFESSNIYVNPRVVVKGQVQGTKDAEVPHVVFEGCTFVRHQGHGTYPFVEVSDGARAVFLGCRFISLSNGAETSEEDAMIRVLGDYAKTITGLTAGSPATVTVDGEHNLAVGDSVYITRTTIHSGVPGVFTVSSAASNARFQATGFDVTGHVISAIGTGSNAQITTTTSHGLTTGDYAYIHGSDATTTPSGGINGTQVVTKINATNFTIPLNVASAGTLPAEAKVVAGNIDGTVSRFSGATNVQLIGCSRAPTGAAYTNLAGDDFVTKTGCI
jgi:hypothetical protein